MTLTLTRCCADEGFACYLNKSHHVGTIMGLTSNRSSAPKVHVNRSHHVLWFAQCRPVNRTVCATHHHSQWGHAATAATPQSSNSSAGRRLAAAAGGGAASPLAGAAQPAAAGAIPGLREAGRSHASAAALLHPGEWLCPSSWMAWEDELWVDARPAAGSRPISATLAMGAGAVAARGHTSPHRHRWPRRLSRPAGPGSMDQGQEALARSSATWVGFTPHCSSLRWRR